MNLTFFMNIRTSKTRELGSTNTDQTDVANKAQGVVARGIADDTAMDVDLLPSFYYTSSVLDAKEAQVTLKTTLNICGEYLREASLGAVVVQRPLNSFWSYDKGALIYGFDHDKKPVLAVYITPDGTGSTIFPLDMDYVADGGNIMDLDDLNQFYIGYSFWF
ncbi:hypothetical protein ONZ45_g15203 [Pleurotus djamor]|nr:hypothetical protein ONZ45_g15203 [Pleurotus djamor]